MPMVPMFWTAALAFSIRLQKKFHVPKIIVTIHRTQKSETALEGGAGFFRDPRVTIIYYFSNPTKSNAAKRRFAALSSFVLVCEWFLYVFVMIFNGFGRFLSIQGTKAKVRLR